MITIVDLKHIFVRVLFALYLILCVWVYWYGAHGLSSLLTLRRECEQLKKEIADTQRQLDVTQEEIIAWNAHSFYKEKMAREQLKMARKDEIVYCLS